MVVVVVTDTVTAANGYSYLARSIQSQSAQRAASITFGAADVLGGRPFYALASRETVEASLAWAAAAAAEELRHQSRA